MTLNCNRIKTVDSIARWWFLLWLLNGAWCNREILLWCINVLKIGNWKIHCVKQQSPRDRKEIKLLKQIWSHFIAHNGKQSLCIVSDFLSFWGTIWTLLEAPSLSSADILSLTFLQRSWLNKGKSWRRWWSDKRNQCARYSQPFNDRIIYQLREKFTTFRPRAHIIFTIGCFSMKTQWKLFEWEKKFAKSWILTKQFSWMNWSQKFN